MKLLIFLLINFSLFIAQTDPIDQSDIYTFFVNGKKYEIITAKMEWAEAADFAYNRGGKLSEINSQSEQDSILANLLAADLNTGNTKAPDGGNAAYIWLGGNDLKEEGKWVWDGADDGLTVQFWEGTSTGSVIDSQYNNWGNEPDNFSNQDALGLALTRWPRGDIGQWNDINHLNLLYSLIEYDSTVVLIDSLYYDYNTGSILVKPIFFHSYDSVSVSVNDTLIIKSENPAGSDSIVSFKFDFKQSSKIKVRLSASDNGKLAYSRISELILISFEDPLSSYSADFEDVSDDEFISESFTIERIFPFRTKGIHSPHDYESNSNISIMLSRPILVNGNNPYMSFSEVVAVEPGDSGSTFGSENFKDYVIIEGSKEVNVWKPLEEGYDSRYNEDWEDLWYNGGLFRDFVKSHTLNLLDQFSAGDTIMIRFRLFSDSEINGWGWQIDDLEIQSPAVGADMKKIIKSEFILKQNYPNPFNPRTTIRYSVPSRVNSQSSIVNLVVYDLLGKQVITLVNEEQNPGEYEIVWDADQLPSGVYFYRLTAGDPSAGLSRQSRGLGQSFMSTRKMLLIK